MPSTPDDRLIELLLRWEELRRQGRDESAEGLCADCPELAPDLARRIGALRAAGTRLGGDDSPGPSATATQFHDDASGESSSNGTPPPGTRYRRLRFHARGGL